MMKKVFRIDDESGVIYTIEEIDAERVALDEVHPSDDEYAFFLAQAKEQGLIK